MKAGETALREHLLNVTRSVLARVPLWLRNTVRATMRWTPLRSVRGFTGSTYWLALLGRVSRLTVLPSIVKVTDRICRPLTDTRNGVP